LFVGYKSEGNSNYFIRKEDEIFCSAKVNNVQKKGV